MEEHHTWMGGVNVAKDLLKRYYGFDVSRWNVRYGDYSGNGQHKLLVLRLNNKSILEYCVEDATSVSMEDE